VGLDDCGGSLRNTNDEQLARIHQTYLIDTVRAPRSHGARIEAADGEYNSRRMFALLGKRLWQLLKFEYRKEAVAVEL
jgi:hypothetical protein